MQTDWERYDELIPKWKPTFGNEQHIRACELVSDINRLEPRYMAAKAKYVSLKSKAAQTRARDSLNKMYDELDQLKRRVLALTGL